MTHPKGHIVESAPAPRGQNPPPAARETPLRWLQVVGGAAAAQSGVTGVERVVQQLVGGLDAERFTHFLAYPVTGALAEWFEPRVAKVLESLPRHRLDLEWVRTLMTFLQQQAIELVVSYGMRYDFLCALACRRAGVPHVVSRAAPLVGDAMPVMRKVLFAAVDTWTLHACSGIVTVSEMSKKRMRASQFIRGGRIAVIPNGVQVRSIASADRVAARHALGVDDAAVLVGGVGRLVAGKQFDRLLHAVTRLQRLAGPPLVVVLVGDGPERPHLERLARELDVRLLLPGFLDDPHPTLAGCDVAVLPSRAEGLPLVVLESMALGVATIATRVGGIPELIQDGDSGLLVPVGETAALAAALQRLRTDRATRRRLGEAAARRVKAHFSVESMLHAFDNYLLSMARAGIRRQPLGPSRAKLGGTLP